jgi:hypothetical protein
MMRRLLLIGMLLIGGGVATASDDVSTEAAPETTPTATPASTLAPTNVQPDLNPGVIMQEFLTGGPRNQVYLQNKQDGRFLSRSAISLHHSNTPNVQPMNVAIAESTCTDCVTMAIALQVFLYKSGAPSVIPQNISISMNVGCTRCVTIARAFQYVIPVADPTQVPDEVRALMRDMEAELRYFATVKTVGELDPDEAMARLTRFTEQHAQLKAYLLDKTDRKADAEPQVVPSVSPSPAATSTSVPASPTAAPSPTDGPSPTPATTTAP